MRRSLLVVAALAACALCANLRAAEPEANATEWELISNKDGVALYRRQRPASNESRAIGEIRAAVQPYSDRTQFTP